MLEVPSSAERFEKIISDWSDGFRKIQLLRAAIELELFDLLKTPKTLEELNPKNERLMKVVLECLVTMGLVERKDGRYQLSEISKTFLTSSSIYSQLRHLHKLFLDLEMWTRLSEVLKEGPIRVDREKFFSEFVVHSMAQHALLGELQRTVKIVAEYDEFKKARRLLDLGGGHALYSIAFTKLNSNLTAIVFDLPEVVKKAREYVKKYGAERVEFLAGDFFVDEIGKGYDIIFSSYNPSGKSVWMIDKIWRALNPGGLYIDKQYFKSGDDKIDLHDLEWNLWVFGDVEKAEKKYTFTKDVDLENYQEKLAKRGFEILDVWDFGEANMIVARKK